MARWVRKALQRVAVEARLSSWIGLDLLPTIIIGQKLNILLCIRLASRGHRQSCVVTDPLSTDSESPAVSKLDPR
jgi:hypothetical protein